MPVAYNVARESNMTMHLVDVFAYLSTTGIITGTATSSSHMHDCDAMFNC